VKSSCLFSIVGHEELRKMTNSPVHIPWAKPTFWGKEKLYVSEALDSTWISGGPFVDRLESEFTALTGVSYVLAMSNGTTSIHAAYLALGLKPGDEIVVPGYGFLCAANIALQMGVKPLFSEVDPDTWCIRATDVEQCLSPKTKAIIPIHTYGNVCAMDEILSLGQKHCIPIIEDTAEALMSSYNGKLAGTMGTIGCYSFQATKTITTGEGGMVVTADQELYDSMALYRSHGMLRRRYYWHELPGHNFRLTNLQAAIGCAQIEKLPVIVSERRRVHERYFTRLSQVSGVTMQQFSHEVKPVVWAVALKLDTAAFPQGRDSVMGQMAEFGIETRPGFYTPSQMQFYKCPSLPTCEDVAKTVISLPSYPTLADEQIDFVCDKLYALRR
jgi:perosamine synthetase